MLWKTEDPDSGQYPRQAARTTRDASYGAAPLNALTTFFANLGSCNSIARMQPGPLLTNSMTAILLLTIVAFSQNNAFANPDDQKKAINVKADTSQYDERAGTQTLSGNVEITQGSMSIKADSIKIELKDGALYRISGKGKPIKFQQLTQTNELMRGQSNQISYDTQTAQITFEGDAEFERPGQKFSGHTIEYNMLKLTFKAAGNTQGRVNITLQPAKVNP